MIKSHLIEPHIVLYTFIFNPQQNNEIAKKKQMEDSIIGVLIEYAAVGDHYVIPTGVDSEIQIIKDMKENLEYLAIAKTDGSARVTIKGRFHACVGPVNVEVCFILKNI